MKQVKLTVLVVALIALPFIGFSHSGHGVFEHSNPLHYVSGVHAVPLAALCLVIMTAVGLILRPGRVKNRKQG